MSFHTFKVLLVLSLLIGSVANAVDSVTATIQASRLNGIITGGAIPYTDPVFVKMVSDIQAGNYQLAATDAVNSNYFPYYLPRRMAKEMMNPQMSESGIPDNDSVAFIVSNWLGLAGTQPSMNAVWTQNATYCVDTTKPSVVVQDTNAVGIGACAAGQVHIYYAGDPLAFDWTQVMVKNNLQTAQADKDSPVQTLPTKDVGGYMTLADAQSDLLQNQYNDFSQYAFTGGTNLRAIEYLYEIALGASLVSMQNTAGVTADMTPKFIPSNNPNFLVGNNQAACISCHGGGAPNRLHGYATVADKFDWDPGSFGFNYFATPSYTSGSLGKSYGSNDDQSIRSKVKTCNQTLNPTIPCNPASPGVSQTQAWDLTFWKNVGLLAKWGWNGAVTGLGLNSLATAVAQSSQAYQFMTQRVISEICPTGAFTTTQIQSIASQAMAKETAAQASSSHAATDQGPFGFIVVQVASDPSCI